MRTADLVKNLNETCGWWSDTTTQAVRRMGGYFFIVKKLETPFKTASKNFRFEMVTMTDNGEGTFETVCTDYVDTVAEVFTTTTYRMFGH